MKTKSQDALPRTEGKTIFFKDEEKGAKEMCQIWEEVREEGIAIGMERSAKDLA